MFFFGHLGVGLRLATPFSKGLPRGALLLGTLLPDLIDKPLYYGLRFLADPKGRLQSPLLEPISNLVSGTRTFGHTALLLLGFTGVAVFRRSRVFAALSLGVATHLLLDNVYDLLMPEYHHSALLALLWPLQGRAFAALGASSPGEHLARVLAPPLLAGELLGLLFLGYDEWIRRNTAWILVRARTLREKSGQRLRSLRRRS